jgi:BCD family chlorophyll transporter-like MFS transporter
MKYVSWFGIVRLGLVNAALGAVVVLTTVTLNRVMVVELALPAILPGLLVALHYAMQVLRPRLGFASDVGGRRTPWIIGGMAMLSAGGMLAAVATALMASHRWAGIALAVPAFVAVGLGVAATGTSLLVLTAQCVAPVRRPAAATILWLLMIMGIAMTATLAGKWLQPFSLALLVRVVCEVAAGAFVLASVAVWGIERQGAVSAPAAAPAFMEALREVWAEPQARRFATFVFISMLAFGALELILEPFAGLVFGLAPAATAKLTGLHQQSIVMGMLAVAIAGGITRSGSRPGVMRAFTVGGCLASAAALVALACAAQAGPGWPLKTTICALGAANGAFTVSAIGAMIGLATEGRGAREGTRMGLWGAAQAIAFALGGLVGTGASDIARAMFGAPAPAYAAVFATQAILFLVAARLAGGAFQRAPASLATDQCVATTVTA